MPVGHKFVGNTRYTMSNDDTKLFSFVLNPANVTATRTVSFQNRFHELFLPVASNFTAINEKYHLILMRDFKLMAIFTRTLSHLKFKFSKK